MLHRMCNDYHCLPGPGGLFDQDCYIIYGLQAITIALNELEKKESQKSNSPKFSSGPSVRRR